MMPNLANIVILTGAGISAESGIATFRDKDGLWAKHQIEDVATPEAYARNPARVLEFYNQRRRPLKDKHPNAAHEALAKLERAYAGDILIVTQNIDDLHERAGSQNLIHMHGQLLKAKCLACGQSQTWAADIMVDSTCMVCGYSGRLRPDIVWFGEIPYEMEEIYTALDQADIFVAIGTSGAVYPAAMFVDRAHRNGSRTIELNLEPSENSIAFEQAYYGFATEIVPAWVQKVLLGI